MLVTPDTFPITTSPTSPRASKDNNISTTSLASRILNGANFSPFSLTTSRHSLPNLDPDDMEDALNQAKLSAYTTNPRRKKNKHHKHQSKQLPSLAILNTKSSKMVHHNSAPVPDGQKLLSAITPPPLSAPANANTDEQDISR